MRSLDNALIAYFSETFSQHIHIKSALHDVNKLPIYFTQRYDVKRIEVFNQPLYLFFQKSEKEKSTPTEIASHLKTTRKIYGEHVAFVFADLLPYERARLIKERIPFIVPRRQTYLPQYMIELREQANAVRNRMTAEDDATSLSASAQVLLLFYLQTIKPIKLWSLREWAKTLGYSTMTTTRICDELVRHKICQTEITGKKICLLFDENRKTLWQQALPYLQSPIKKTVSVAHVSLSNFDHRIAGITALSSYTKIAESTHPVYAMNSSTYQRALLDQQFLEQKYRDPTSLIIEQWRYRPSVLSNSNTVDKLSLYLSMKDDPDERIVSALDELLEGLPW